MGYQVIKQPDGHLAIFCSSSDTIVVWDADEAEAVEWFADLAAERARREARQVVGHVVAGEPRRVYFQFTKTWDEALESDRGHGGEAWEQFARTGEGNDW